MGKLIGILGGICNALICSKTNKVSANFPTV